MKIGMQTWGSHGDIRPFLALAEGLQADGHDVTLVITCVDHARHDASQIKNSVTLVNIASPVFKDEATLRRVGESIVNERNPLKQVTNILKLAFFPVEDQMSEAAKQLCEDNDLIIGHFFHYPLQAWAEKTGKPYVTVMLQHTSIATPYLSPPGLPDCGKWINPLLWRLTNALLNRCLKSYANNFRRKLGMQAVNDLIEDVWLSKKLTLIAVSKQLCQRQAGWPDYIEVCGFLNMPNIEMEGTLSKPVEDFIAAGDAPIYMTFGSLMPKDITMQTKTLEMFTDAAKRANCRAIIQTCDAESCGFSSSYDILYVNSLPHRQIFPACKLIVHHGGAGTTQTSSFCGKPSIVIAHIEEQKFWGNELRRLGLTHQVLSRRRVNADILSNEITNAINDKALTANAERVATLMQQENGVVMAVKLINQLSEV